MGYIRINLTLPFYYYAIAVAVGLVSYLIKKKWKISLLISYMVLVYSIAVLNRPIKPRQINLHFFRMFGHMNWQVYLNIMLFIPIGMLLVACKRSCLWIGLLFSIVIEASQLMLQRGQFDVDDIVSNCAGLIIGFFLFIIMRRIHWMNS